MDQKTAATPLRRAVGAAVLLLALGTATACGSATSGPAAASPSASAASPSASPSNLAPLPADPPKPSAEPTPAETRPGIAVGEPDPSGRLAGSQYRVDGLRLSVTFYGGICEKYGLKLDESKPGTVLAKVVVTEPQKAGMECAALAKQQEVSADLKSQWAAGRSSTRTPSRRSPAPRAPTRSAAPSTEHRACERPRRGGAFRGTA